MPVVGNSRARIESSTTAEALIAGLPESELAFWALALFAGLRRGELGGLQVDAIDFDAGLVRVCRGWEDLEGELDPKTFAGAREIPMIGELRRICGAHKLQTGRHGTQLFLTHSSGLFLPVDDPLAGAEGVGVDAGAQSEPRSPAERCGSRTGPTRSSR